MDKICKGKGIGKNSRKLSLYPLEFEEAVENLLKVKPKTRNRGFKMNEPRVFNPCSQKDETTSNL